MHLIAQTYDLIELQQARSELEKRGIRVHVSDEFTYAIPGMPGAEQPRGIWVALDEDVAPARRVVADLLGPERVAGPDQQASPDAAPAKTSKLNWPRQWHWLAWIVLLATLWVAWRTF